MNKIAPVTRLFTALLIFLCNLTFLDIAFAEDGKNCIFAAQNNSVWVLNKTTRKMIFVRFEKQREIWKSDPFQIPATYNIDHCAFQIAGRYGQAIVLFDTSSGVAAVYEVKGNRSIEKYLDLSLPENDKGYAVSSKGKHAWIFNRSSGALSFVRFEGRNKKKEALPKYISPFLLNYDNCQMKSVGKYGEGVVLFDPATGIAVFFTAKRKGERELSITRYMDSDTKKDLQ